MDPTKPARLAVHPLTLERWPDFEALFGARGGVGGCWCMWFRLARRDFESKKGAGTKRAMKSLVRKGVVPGLLGYSRGEPVAWISVGPREEYSLLARSRVAKPIDDEPVWSVVCILVRKDWRRRGASVRMLEGAASWARRRGARWIEGYAVEPRKQAMPDVFACSGLASAYRRAGFREVARHAETRPIMRRRLRAR